MRTMFYYEEGLRIMHMKDSDLAAIEGMLRGFGCKWINTNRVSKDWKAKIYEREKDGRQVGIYDRKMGFVLRLENIPELPDLNVVECAKGGLWNHKESHFRSGKGFCVKFSDIASVKDLLSAYFNETQDGQAEASRKESNANNDTPERRASQIDRIIRNTVITRNIKLMYDFQCQVCGVAIKTKDGLYAEGAHIRGLGEPHNGPDIEENVLCLCPNHHAMFDKGGFHINDDFSLIGIEGILRVDSRHDIRKEFLEYHRNNI